MNRQQRFTAPQRLPRSKWKIPLPDSPERHLSKLEEAARGVELSKGTTPQGREILRKAIFTAERMLKLGGFHIDEVVREVGSRLVSWEVLGPEHSKLLSRLWGGSEHGWFNIGPQGMAKLIVLRTAMLNDAKSAAKNAG